MLIVLSSPFALKNEMDQIYALFDEGLEIFHLRKKDFKLEELKEFIEKLPIDHLNKVVLHSHYQLVDEFGLKGIQISTTYNAWKPLASVGVSFHSIQEIENYANFFDYGFISPVFDSISKKNYESKFDLIKLGTFLNQCEKPILALGGVDIDKIEQVRELGFSGFALLGAIWQADDPIVKFRRIKQKWKM